MWSLLTNVTDGQTDGRTDVKRSHDRYIAKACSGKNIQVIPTRCQILRLKCTKFKFGWAPPRPAASSVCGSADPLIGSEGPTSKWREEKGQGWKWKGRREKRKEREEAFWWCAVQNNTYTAAWKLVNLFSIPSDLVKLVIFQVLQISVVFEYDHIIIKYFM